MRRFVIAAGTILLAAACLSAPALAQTGDVPCDSFQKNPDGSWVAVNNASLPGAGRVFHVQQGANFKPGASFMGISVVEMLDKACPVEAIAATAPPQIDLLKLAGPGGIIDAEKLTCGQLASTYQEDADFLLVWYSGLHSGISQQHQIDVPRVKAGIHNVIVYCKSNRDKLLVQAIDIFMR